VSVLPSFLPHNIPSFLPTLAFPILSLPFPPYPSLPTLTSPTLALPRCLTASAPSCSTRLCCFSTYICTSQWPDALGKKGKEAVDLSLPEPPTEKEAVDLSLPELLQEMLLYGLTEYATTRNGQPYDPPRHVEGFGKAVCHHIKNGQPLPAFIRDEIMSDLRDAKLNQ
jgi:hypothetical protein